MPCMPIQTNMEICVKRVLKFQSFNGQIAQRDLFTRTRVAEIIWVSIRSMITFSHSRVIAPVNVAVTTENLCKNWKAQPVTIHKKGHAEKMLKTCRVPIKKKEDGVPKLASWMLNIDCVPGIEIHPWRFGPSCTGRCSSGAYHLTSPIFADKLFSAPTPGSERSDVIGLAFFGKTGLPFGCTRGFVQEPPNSAANCKTCLDSKDMDVILLGCSGRIW